VGDVICKKLDTSTNGVFVSAEPNTCEAMAGRLPAYCADSEPICKDCETIPVTVMLERTSNEYSYSNFQLISGDGYIAVGTNSGRPCGGD
jgi:hypothetical protein